MIKMQMMIVVAVLLGVIAGAGAVCLWRKYVRLKEEKKKDRSEKEKIEITLQDIIRLAALSTTLDVNSLLIEYKINIKMPEFYEKYQGLTKREKELYFNELITIFSKNKREYVQDLFDRYAGLTPQDVLLLLMSEMQIENKTMARIMGLGIETLKKRKTRLKVKMQITGSFKDAAIG